VHAPQPWLRDWCCCRELVAPCSSYCCINFGVLGSRQLGDPRVFPLCQRTASSSPAFETCCPLHRPFVCLPAHRLLAQLRFLRVEQRTGWPLCLTAPALLQAQAAVGPRPGDLGSRREHGGNLAGAMMDTQAGSAAAGEAAIELLAAAAALPGDSPEARQAEDRLTACQEATPGGSPQAANSPPGTPGAAATPASGLETPGGLEVGCGLGAHRSGAPGFAHHAAAQAASVCCHSCCRIACLQILDAAAGAAAGCSEGVAAPAAGDTAEAAEGEAAGAEVAGGPLIHQLITASPCVACSGCQALCCTHDAMQHAL
jgi:hypothetical protein